MHLYEFGREYPPEVVGTDRMRDAMYGIYVMVGVGAILSAVWIVAGIAYQKNQAAYHSLLTEEEKTAGHAWLDTSMPLSLCGNTLRINRGFSILTMDINEIVVIHIYMKLLGRRRPIAVVFHKVNGKRKLLLFERSNASGVKAVLEKVRQANLSITVIDEADI